MCRDVSDANKRIFFEEAYERERARNQREHSERKQLQQDVAKQMKKAGSLLELSMPWAEARETLLDNGYADVRKLSSSDGERVRTRSCT